MQDAALQHLVDRAELHDLVLRYAAGVDRRDWDQIRTCFVPDLKVVEWGDGPFADREEMLEHKLPVFARHMTPLTGRTRLAITAGRVFRKIVRSVRSPRVRRYCMSRRIHSSKPIWLRPAICQRHVMPGFTSRRRRCHGW